MIKATTENERLAAEQIITEKPKVVAEFAPIYCNSHKTIKFVKVDTLISKGFPVFEGVGAFNSEQCRTIIEKLYELDSNKDRIRSVAAGKVSIGMRVEFAIYSWGFPDDYNSTNTSFGTSMQWVYGDPIKRAQYVYIDNGVVTATQDN